MGGECHSVSGIIETSNLNFFNCSFNSFAAIFAFGIGFVSNNFSFVKAFYLQDMLNTEAYLGLCQTSKMDIFL